MQKTRRLQKEKKKVIFEMKMKIHSSNFEEKRKKKGNN